MVSDIVIHALASAAYAGLAWHFWNTRWHSVSADAAAGPAGWERVALLAALAFHGALLADDVLLAPQLRFGFAQALSIMLWLTIAILWIESWFYRIETLYPMALAAAALCAPLPAFFPGRLTPEAFPVEFRLHLIAGMLAYSLFTVATLHAVLIAKIERQLHAHPAVSDSGTPPLLSLEALVFRLTGAAFVVLTLTFAIGIAFSESFLGRALRFDHKTVFVILSWATFGALLAGRALYGWRGRTAFRWTLTGFLMLMLAYPGSRFVLEVILGRV